MAVLTVCPSILCLNLGTGHLLENSLYEEHRAGHQSSQEHPGPQQLPLLPEIHRDHSDHGKQGQRAPSWVLWGPALLTLLAASVCILVGIRRTGEQQGFGRASMSQFLFDPR